MMQNSVMTFTTSVFSGFFYLKKGAFVLAEEKLGTPLPETYPPQKKTAEKQMRPFFLFKGNIGGTVDGQNPAPPRMMIIPLFLGF